jgi:hypothetical protein
LWLERGTPAPLTRWLAGLLDARGVPRQLPVAAWGEVLTILDEARGARSEGWPDALDARAEALLLARLRFARAGGAAVFTSPAERPEVGLPSLLHAWAERLSEPGLTTVLDWWFAPRASAREGPRASPREGPRAAARQGKRRRHAPPPLPAWSSPDYPLAILRADWSARGDLLAVDHRRAGATAQLELTGLGQVLLGPTWTADAVVDSDPTPDAEADAAPRPPRARMRLWMSNSAVDLAEWSFRAEASRVTRTALLLRGRRIALLADQVEHGRGTGVGQDGPAAWRLDLPPGIEATPADGRIGWTLTPRRGSPQAQLLPIALPCRGLLRERGTLTLDGRAVCLHQPRTGRRTWLPLLVSWDPLRNRKAIHWRVLTVAEKSRVCPPDRAFAARISWGRDDTLLVYRSLGPPALRSFLGHQTTARFLVALFDREGTVTPIVTVE